jgi:hypothetical protein
MYNSSRASSESGSSYVGGQMCTRHFLRVLVRLIKSPPASLGRPSPTLAALALAGLPTAPAQWLGQETAHSQRSVLVFNMIKVVTNE